MREIFERFDKYMRLKGLNDNKVTVQCGLSQGLLGQARTGKSDLGKKTIDKILNVYQDINRFWLLTGEGEMLKGSSAEKETLNPPIEENEKKHGVRMIPFYDAETTGGYNGHVATSDGEVALKGYVNAGGWFDGRETAAIRHYGDSMIEYPNGCILAVREVRNMNLLVPGRNYVVETEEYRVTKRVQKGSRSNMIALYSTNQQKYDDGRLIYEPFEIDVQDIRRVFSVLGYIVNQYGEAQLIRI